MLMAEFIWHKDFFFKYHCPSACVCVSHKIPVKYIKMFEPNVTKRVAKCKYFYGHALLMEVDLFE